MASSQPSSWPWLHTAQPAFTAQPGASRTPKAAGPSISPLAASADAPLRALWLASAARLSPPRDAEPPHTHLPASRPQARQAFD